jgi:DNA-binding transcriptional LysR family regulator
MGSDMQLNDRVGRRLKLHDLHVLMAVVASGSMSKAAALLSTTQPAVSRAIAELERSFGVRLLDRTTQGVAPTEFGRALADGGTVVFDDLRHIVTKIEFLADPEAGEVRIGCNPVLAASFVSAVVERIMRRYPRIVFHLVAARAESLYRDLRERNIDLLVARRFGPLAGEQLAFEFLFDDSYVIAAGAQHPFARRRRIAFAELAGQSWVLPPPHTVPGAVLMNAMRAKGFDYPRATVTTESPEARMSLLATGQLLTIVAASVLRFRAKPAEVNILPIDLPSARVPNGVITLKDRTLSPVTQLFVEHARAIARPLASKK